MILFGIASILLSLAVMVFAAAALCKAVGWHIEVKPVELSEEEKEALKAEAKANQAYIDNINKLMSFGNGGGLF